MDKVDGYAMNADEPPGATAIPTVHAALGHAYGRPARPHLDPLDELILTVLSQSTTDRNRDRAWETLRSTWTDWEGVLHASSGALEAAIRVAGLAAQKSATILGILERLEAEVGHPDLAHLEKMPDEEALDYLTGFRGVGVKTAACVLCFSLRRPVLPVDTHVHRVAARLGLVPQRSSAVAAHRILNEIVPPEIRFDLHLQLIEHGRRVCRARRPSCEDCPLAAGCPRVGVNA